MKPLLKLLTICIISLLSILLYGQKDRTSYNFSKGLVAIKNNDYDSAAKYFEKEFDIDVRLAPDYSSGYSFWAEFYFNREEYNKAVNDSIAVLTIDQDGKAYWTLAFTAEKDFDMVVSCLKVAFAKEPANRFWK